MIISKKVPVLEGCGIRLLRVCSAGLIIYLLCVSQVFATATYNSSLVAKLTFSNLWDNYSPTAMGYVAGDGQHLENASAPFPVFDTSNFSVSQSVFAYGSAGDANFNVSGTSEAGISATTNLTFNFPLTGKPTKLTITFTEFNSIANASTDLMWNEENQTGEDAQSDSSLRLSLDGQYCDFTGWTVGDAVTFKKLRGQHVISIYTGAGGSAKATYPYDPNTAVEPTALYASAYRPTPTPVPAAVWLFGSGLLGLVGIRRKFRK